MATRYGLVNGMERKRLAGLVSRITDEELSRPVTATLFVERDGSPYLPCCGAVGFPASSSPQLS